MQAHQSAVIAAHRLHYLQCKHLEIPLGPGALLYARRPLHATVDAKLIDRHHDIPLDKIPLIYKDMYHMLTGANDSANPLI